MAKLLFFDNDHKYTLDDEEVPSVSEVSRFISREVYGQINQYTLDNASDRGTKVHKAIENILRFGDCEIEDGIAPYVQGFVKWFRDSGLNKSDILDIEKAYGHSELKYAGTMDLVAMVKGKRTLIDFKTSCTAQKKLWTITENGYRILRDFNCEDKIEQILILHLKKDGTCKEIELPIDDSGFMACITLHNILKTKKRAKKENLENE